MMHMHKGNSHKFTLSYCLALFTSCSLDAAVHRHWLYSPHLLIFYESLMWRHGWPWVVYTFCIPGHVLYSLGGWLNSHSYSVHAALIHLSRLVPSDTSSTHSKTSRNRSVCCLLCYCNQIVELIMLAKDGVQRYYWGLLRVFPSF